MSKRRGRPVDIMHALRANKQTKRSPNVQIVADRLLLETDPLAYAIPFAEAVVEQTRAYILAGKNPSGRPAKPLDPEYAKQRKSTGPRGVRTGKTLDTLRVDSGTGTFGRNWVDVKIEQPYGPGQFENSMQARFTYDPDGEIVTQALDELVNVILAPDDGGNDGR